MVAVRIMCLGFGLIFAVTAHGQAPAVPAAEPSAAEPSAAESAAEPSVAESGTPAALPASTEDRTAEARRLFLEGVELAGQERWRESTDAFTRSRALVERPSTVFNLAGALYRLGKLVRAQAAFRDYLRISDSDVDAFNRSESERLLGVLESAVGTLVLTVEPAEAVVKLNDERVEGVGTVRAITVDPGDHTLDVQAEGYRGRTLPLHFDASQRLEQTVRLEELPTDPVIVSAAALPPAGFTLTQNAHRDDSSSVLASPWFWLATAVVVGGGVTAAILLTQDPEEAKADGGNTGTVITGLTWQ